MFMRGTLVGMGRRFPPLQATADKGSISGNRFDTGFVETDVVTVTVTGGSGNWSISASAPPAIANQPTSNTAKVQNTLASGSSQSGTMTLTVTDTITGETFPLSIPWTLAAHAVPAITAIAGSFNGAAGSVQTVTMQANAVGVSSWLWGESWSGSDAALYSATAYNTNGGSVNHGPLGGSTIDYTMTLPSVAGTYGIRVHADDAGGSTSASPDLVITFTVT